ncbi:hypothetical protein J3U68_07940 [Snodgrassella sp. B3882]|uniref:hypothetical protein n=1 Tax=Snodgrassella sp. B3882 TaxID=2818037 RepID=UPI0022699F7B|nr:hypothetical protein [Snodgrassella sp. B3882]MCX8745337.1 hypothetical protein [Snodgrassella sp. B3882]
MINDPENIAKVTIDKDVPYVNTGDYINQIIDLADIYEYDKVPYGMSGIAAIMHEIVEQYEKSKHGTPIGSAGRWDKNQGGILQDENSDFNKDHANAVKVQNKIDNTDRTQGDIIDINSGRKYIMFYIDQTNNKVVGITEQKKGNQFTPQKTEIKTDKDGYYDLGVNRFDDRGNPQFIRARFKLKNGKPIK